MARTSSPWGGERRQANMDLFSAHAECYLEYEKYGFITSPRFPAPAEEFLDYEKIWLEHFPLEMASKIISAQNLVNTADPRRKNF